jgi:nucleoside-diphosphate-sugar epimerase
MDTQHDDKPVLVTGATGFTGGALALELRRRGRRVRALVRDPRKAQRLVQAGVEIVEGDIINRDAVLRAAQGVGLIYHIAALFRTAGHPDSYYHDVNVTGVENIIAAAQTHGPRRTVHCSTVGVHGHVGKEPVDETAPYNPGDVYQVTKLAGEKAFQAALAQGLPGVIFRPAGIYGPGDLRFLKLFKAIKKGRFVMIGSGETNYHFTFIDDLVEGIILCGEHPAAPGEIFILCGESQVTLNQMVKDVAAAVGVKPPRWRVPLGPVMLAAKLCQAVCVPLRINPPLHKRRVEFFIKDRAFNGIKARRLLGFNPKVSVAEGMRRTAAWYFEQGLL